MAGGTGPEPLLSPPPLGRFLSNGSSSGGESSSGDAVDERSGPPIAGPSRITAGGAKGGTPPLDLYRLMRRLSTSSSSSSASSSFGSARRSASASEGDSEATGSSEGSFVWLAVVRRAGSHVRGRQPDPAADRLSSFPTVPAPGQARARRGHGLLPERSVALLGRLGALPSLTPRCALPLALCCLRRLIPRAR